MRINYTAELPKARGYRPCKNQQIIAEFANSGRPFAKIELDNGEYKKPSTAAAALKHAIKSMHVDLTAKTIGGAVWLFNIPLMDKEGLEL